jgi:glycosyltransferase involved in cell wall biosynthesis
VAPPALSVVLPAFNEADSIVESIAALDAVLRASDLDFEIIVVSDGSADGTGDRARACENLRVRVVEYERNMGKGYALRTGSKAATGAWIAWLDADLDLKPDSLKGFFDVARREGADIVIGSKRHPDSEVEYPWYRRMYSWLYQQLIRVLFTLNVRDTQVGIKLFRRDALEAVLPVVLVKRYAFDLEVLAVARRFGFGAIVEQPVKLHYRFSGTGMNWRAITNALIDTFAVFYRLRVLRFYDRKRQLVRRMAEHAALPAPTLSVAIVGDLTVCQDDVAHVVENTAHGTPIICIARDETDTAWLREVVEQSTTGAIALLETGMRVGPGWATSACDLLRDPQIAVVAGPTMPRLGGDPRSDAAAILSESRFGVGGARVRSHVGALTEVRDFPARNLIVRRIDLVQTLADGLTQPDDLCRSIRARSRHAIVVSPDVVALTPSLALFRPYLARLWTVGIDRGRRLGRNHRFRFHHLAPLILAIAILAAVPALLLGPPAATFMLALGAVYVASVLIFAGVIAVLHRRPRVTTLTAIGAVASHAVFGFGMLAGVIARVFRRRRRSRPKRIPRTSHGTD